MSIKNLFADELLSIERNMCPDNTIECITAASYEPYGVWSHNQTMTQKINTYEKNKDGTYIFNGESPEIVVGDKRYLSSHKSIDLDSAIKAESVCGFYIALTGEMGGVNRTLPLEYIPNWNSDNLVENSFSFEFNNGKFIVNYYLLIRDGDKYLMNAKFETWLDILQNSGDYKAYFGEWESKEIFELPISKLRGDKNGVIIRESLNEENKMKKYNKISVDRNDKSFQYHIGIKADYAVENKIVAIIRVEGKGDFEFVIEAGQTCSPYIKLSVWDMYKNISIFNLTPEVTETTIYKQSQLYSPYQIKSAESSTIRRILDQYKNGRESMSITAVLNDETKISVGDTVELWKCRRGDMEKSEIDTNVKITDKKMIENYAAVRSPLGDVKQYIVTSAEIKYNGTFRQNLDLLEV